MAYTPPTPTLPEGEEMQKVLDAFEQLPQAKFAWQGYTTPGRKPNITLFAVQSGQPSILQSSADDGFLFRNATGYMQDVNEIVQPKREDERVSILDNSAAIALASAWMVPLLHAEVNRLRLAMASVEGELLGTLLALTTLSPDEVTPAWRQKVADLYREKGGTQLPAAAENV